MKSPQVVGALYLNLPCRSVEKARVFWTTLGFEINEQFSNEQAICVIMKPDQLYVMFVDPELYQTFTHRPIADGTTTQMLAAIDVGSREEVNRLTALALEQGAVPYLEPGDYGWMYYTRFVDLDGHQWELMTIDESQYPANEVSEPVL